MSKPFDSGDLLEKCKENMYLLAEWEGQSISILSYGLFTLFMSTQNLKFGQNSCLLSDTSSNITKLYYIVQQEVNTATKLARAMCCDGKGRKRSVFGHVWFFDRKLCR